MGYTFNPFTGNLDRINTGDVQVNPVAVAVTVDYFCDVGTVIGDIVVADTAVAGKVNTVTSNVYSGLALGVVVAKPDSTTCSVQMIGIITVSGASFGVGKPIFIGPDGIFTTVRPTTGSIQIMGISASATQISLIPSTNKVTLVS